MTLEVPTAGQSRGASDQHELIDLAFDAMFTRSFDERSITSWNRGAERLYGWTRAEALGKNATELLCSEYPIPLEQIEEELKSTGEWQGQIVQCHKSGRRITAKCRWGLQSDNAGRPVAILEINSDLSQQRQATERLTRSEERFRLLVSAVVEYAIFMLDPDGTIVSWNEGAQRIKGYTADEIIGRHFSVFYTPEDRAAKLPTRVLQKARRHGQFRGEGWRVRQDGTRFWASVVITALRDESGGLQGFAKVTRDITDKHQEEARLRDYAREMAELERAKAQFLDFAAHELRTPLTLIRGYNSMLEDGKLPPERVPQIAKSLEGKLEQMNLLVEQMLEVGRLESDRLELDNETIDLYDVVKEQIEKLRAIARTNDIAFTGRRDDAIVNADRDRIGTVIANLLDNAIKYSPAGGGIECSVGRQGSWACVSVRDQGLGIAPEHIPLLFKRYTRLPTEANKRIRGTGLGLYLCQEIARRQGGQIRVESTPAKGSEFTLQLPLVNAAALPQSRS
jgi:PAS domain S-box-containing protein